MIELKLPFGLRDGQLFHVSEVESGLACNCFCPACGQPLVARKGAKVTHHFAHYKAETCEHAVETALHLAAKDILFKEKQIRIPAVEVE
ncbi:MAG TPA: competence protein CoiA family protein, partial [Phototrophicaceae bacterium]|nr:competence protein CoiA family protein [Phototrophicaceae bacterium]